MKKFEITDIEKEVIRTRLFWTYFYYFDRIKIDDKYFEEKVNEFRHFLNEHKEEYLDDENNEMWNVLQIMEITELKYRVQLMIIALMCEMFEQFLINILVKKLDLKKEITFKEAKKIFSDFGFNIEKSKQWKKINELRLLVNVIKHGDGVSKKRLNKIRKDFFYNTKSKIGNALNDMTLNVQEEDLTNYFCVILNFINDMPREFKKQDEKCSYLKFVESINLCLKKYFAKK